jgi:hypothetical protein
MTPEEQAFRAEIREAVMHFWLAWVPLSKLVHEANVRKGFWPENKADRNVGEMLALIHSEISEGLEAYRHNNAPDDHLPEYLGLSVELADAVIRILDMDAGLDLRVSSALSGKLLYNLSRPHKHGKTL